MNLHERFERGCRFFFVTDVALEFETQSTSHELRHFGYLRGMSSKRADHVKFLPMFSQPVVNAKESGP